MNKLFKYIGCALFSGLALAACSPDEFSGADQNGLPTMDGRQITVETDQETNTAVFSLSGDFKGCYPVWYLDGKPYSLLPTASFSSMEQGTHDIEVRLMNRNGQSQAGLTGSFTFNETKIDYTPYFNKLCGKTWRIDYAEKGHLGCGEPGSDGSNWWAAGPNEKADFGVYDDRVSFSHSDTDAATGGSYSYDPGEGGTAYVNKDCSILGNTPGGSEDVMIAVSAQNSSFTLIPGTFNDEDCLYMQFAPNTLLPYIGNDKAYNEGLYRIEALTNTRLVLVQEEGTISWRLVFTSREDTGMPDDGGDEAKMDWNYNAASNLWKSVDEGDNFTTELWFANNDWAQIADPVWKHEGNVFDITIPDGIGTQQWQGQFKIHTAMALDKTKKYNLYCVVESDNDIPQMTFKLTDKADDNNFLVAERKDITADKAFVYKAEGISLPKGSSTETSLIFDFGGAPAGTNVKISQIYLEEAISYDDEANLWKSVDAGDNFTTELWFANNDWSQIADPVWKHEGNAFELDIPEGIGTQQWQGQFKIHTGLSASMTDSYTFVCTVVADNDIPQMTFKLTDKADDNNFFFADRKDITADKAFTYKMTGAKLPVGNADALSLIFDFGGAPAGTHVKISDVILIKE